ncbi:MAG TPA: methionine gamma-lyase family protein [Candidatus Baltobacteraceae bacterium]|nr:methionine gamma-lyase family protein [Candidatus Baltobacteraceae bacterium]
MIELLCERFTIGGTVREAALRAYERTRDLTYPAQAQVKVRMLRAFFDEGIDESELAGTSGYGYDDAARARYESLLARVLGAERVLARLSIVSGTHAIVTALAACVPPGKRLIAAAGAPYDTLRNAICDAPHSLTAQGAVYQEIALRDDGTPDLDAIARAAAQADAAAVFVQRSRGYAPRPSLDIAACERIAAAVKSTAPRVAVLVDNCYGELVEEAEPSEAGADLVMGSLIKNLGGSLAPGGGYIAGRSDLLERVSARLYAPGLRGALGPTLGFGRAFIQGLFLAPAIVEQTLRGLDFAAALFEELGFEVDPQPGAHRTDIVQAIRLGDPGRLLRFAGGLQSAMPVNARFRPEPGPVPGYADPVVMSSGAFVSGATIELSCDAPLRAPYEVYLQGGVVAEHAMLGVLLAAQALAAGDTAEGRGARTEKNSHR